MFGVPSHGAMTIPSIFPLLEAGTPQGSRLSPGMGLRQRVQDASRFRGKRALRPNFAWGRLEWPDGLVSVHVNGPAGEMCLQPSWV
jgi:hypothetical protein